MRFDSVNSTNRLMPWLILAYSPIALANAKVSVSNHGGKDVILPKGAERKSMCLRIPAARKSAEELQSPLTPRTWSSRKVIREKPFIQTLRGKLNYLGFNTRN